ncbi:MAG: hypothetical protein PHG96_06150 [Kiritimatiellae bacterium]|nr:hypothetical protein [Kiritimatiellia bacterium]
MNALFAAAKEVCDFMKARRWKFCIIGGLAVQRWGEPRATLDADLTLLTGFGDEDRYVTVLLDAFDSRIEDGLNFALTRRVLLLKASNGKQIDISLGALPFEASMMRRAVHVEFCPGLTLPCCTAEDLFVMKAFASRPKDWLDAESIVTRQGSLNRRYILEQLCALCELKETPEIVERAQRLLARKR